MSKIALTGTALLCLGCAVAATGWGQALDARAPSDADQLVIVRLTAALNDAYARRDRAQLEYNRALRDVQDLQPELQKAVEAAKSKLPAPAAGMQWTAQPDGLLGIKFVQAPVAGGKQQEAQSKGADEHQPATGQAAKQDKK